VETSWDVCERKVRGRTARYRGFTTRAEALAWLEAGAPYQDREANKAEALREFPEDGVFFDAGTGSGRGVEVRVSDREGAPMIHLAGDPPREGTLTRDGNLLLGHGRTNNYGELLACRLAILIAEERGATQLFGDSQLVLDYWSKGHV
jgi:ribonuclease HI